VSRYAVGFEERVEERGGATRDNHAWVDWGPLEEVGGSVLMTGYGDDIQADIGWAEDRWSLSRGLCFI
jgi:hypothetical protein